jgi:hypothetical protein
MSQPDYEPADTPPTVSFELWVDYHRTDGQGLTHTHVDDVEAQIELVPGAFVVVGNEEADPAVAEVVSVEPDGLVLVRVLPGAAEEHLPPHRTPQSPRLLVNGNDELEAMIEVDPELARQAAVELYGREAVEAAEAAFDEVCMAQSVIEQSATT